MSQQPSDKHSAPPNVRKLFERLQEMGATRFGFTWAPGTDDLSADAKAGEVLKALDALERGDYEVVDRIGDAALSAPSASVPINDGTAHLDHPLRHFDRTCLACWQETEAAPSHERPSLSAYVDKLEKRATEQAEWENHPKCESSGVADTMHGIVSELRELLRAEANAPPSSTERTCPDCKGSGTVTRQTQHLGPDDYEVTETCPKCDGTGAVAVSATRRSCNTCGASWDAPVEACPVCPPTGTSHLLPGLKAALDAMNESYGGSEDSSTRSPHAAPIRKRIAALTPSFGRDEPFDIYVNGTVHQVAVTAATYESVLALAGHKPERILSVTYRTKRKGDVHREGIMHPGCNPVLLEDGMRFDVGDTSNA